jgi:SAM-dependent methyltransferase
MTALEFWNRRFSEGGAVRGPSGARASLARALDHFGDMTGKTVIDLGCGRGEAALFFAAHGARVLAVDTSEVALDNLERFCRDHQIDAVQGHLLSALEIDRLGPQDFVHGSMILHHLEPFDQFACTLRSVVRPNGRGFFYENNAASRTMVWFRQHVVGRFGVPKYGDDEEFPLTPDEVDALRRYFSVEQDFPEFVYFELASMYLTKGRFSRPARRLDEVLHRCEPLRRYSYRQELRLS